MGLIIEEGANAAGRHSFGWFDPHHIGAHIGKHLPAQFPHVVHNLQHSQVSQG